MSETLTYGLPEQHGDTADNPGALCTNLRRIDLQDFIGDDSIQTSWCSHLGTLLCHNQRLTYVAVPLEVFGINASPTIISTLQHRRTHVDVQYDFFEIDGVAAALSKLWNLLYLEINCVSEQASFKKPYLFLQSCLALPQPTELMIHRDVGMYWDQDEDTAVVRKIQAIIEKATIARFSHGPTAKKIKSLQLPSNPTGSRNPLPLLLLKSRLLDLETCEIPWFRGDASIREIQQVVREHCPNLKHLVFPQLYDEIQDGQAARAFIRSCSGLQSFTSMYFSDGSDHAPRFVLSELVKYHHITLEVLQLTDSDYLCSRDLQNILSQCKQLKQFRVINYQEEDSMSGITFSDICSSDWVCTDLRELGLTLSRYPIEFDAFGNFEETVEEAQVTASTVKRVY
ncbi:hypothetical protein EC968_006547 [Mortierella alpina]|nr:hypothetical protein EC968_006547 [Mortierella alpina]